MTTAMGADWAIRAAEAETVVLLVVNDEIEALPGSIHASLQQTL